MTRHIALGNGSLLVNIDEWLQVRDLYYPHVGQENHILGNANRIGIFEKGQTSWINEQDWKRELAYKKDTLVSDTKAHNKSLRLTVELNDCVHHEKDVFLRRIKIVNDSDRKRSLTVLFHHDFNLYADGVGDTAGWDPVNTALFHYKRKRYILIDLKQKGSRKPNDIHEYTAGKEGASFEDAKDGKLSKNPMAQGRVDSAISTKIELEPNSSKTLHYWVCMGRDFGEAIALDQEVIRKGPEKLMLETEKHWQQWLKPVKLHGLDKKTLELYKRSLLIIRTQIDNYGGIIAANDSDNVKFNRDTYSYVWPRDAALVSLALQKAGYSELTKPFYKFCQDILSEAGCFLHKYTPDSSLGSSWHPYIENGLPQLPMQEDGTALVLAALADYYERTKDKKLLYELYLPLIKPMANFLVKYRFNSNGLPRESYDLWEERRGILTFTCTSVCWGLRGAASIAKALKDPDHKAYTIAAKEVHDAVLKYLYDPELERFVRMINFDGGSVIKDSTIESSLYSTFAFCGLAPDDEKVMSTMNAIIDALSVKTDIGGFARYDGDYYYREDKKTPGNPWFICSAWVAEWLVKKAKKRSELKEAKKHIDWMVSNALPTGILPEQIGAITGKPHSVAPLTWSHAAFVNACIEFSEKWEKLGG